MLIYLPVMSRPLIPCKKKQFYLPVTFSCDHPHFDSLHSEFLSLFNFATHEAVMKRHQVSETTVSTGRIT